MLNFCRTPIAFKSKPIEGSWSCKDEGCWKPPKKGYPRNETQYLTDCKCGTQLDNLDWVNVMNKGKPKEVKYYYHLARSEVTFSTGKEAGTTFQVNPLGGPGFNAKVMGSETVKIGEPLIKMFKPKGKRIMCSNCFKKNEPELFQNVQYSLVGLGRIVFKEPMKKINK